MLRLLLWGIWLTFILSAQPKWKLLLGTAAPSGSLCDADNVGGSYLRNGDPASVPPAHYVCRQTGASTYTWQRTSHIVGTTAPATCDVGEVFFDSDATAGQNWFGCTSANTWTQQGGSGGSHNILSATHSDTTGGGAEAQGDVLVRNGSSQWARLAVGGSNKALKSNGTTVVYTTQDVPGAGTCTNQFVRAANADAAPTCASVGTTDISNDAVTRDKVSAILRTRQIIFILGAENGSALADGDDQPTIFANRLGSGITITEVWCESDAGTPSVNLQRDDGTPANILSANLSCSTSGATGTIDTNEDNVANGERIDFVMVTAGGTAKRVTVGILYTVD